jgi:hypothetical protein
MKSETQFNFECELLVTVEVLGAVDVVVCSALVVDVAQVVGEVVD